MWSMDLDGYSWSTGFGPWSQKALLVSMPTQGLGSKELCWGQAAGRYAHTAITSSQWGALLGSDSFQLQPHCSKEMRLGEERRTEGEGQERSSSSVDTVPSCMALAQFPTDWKLWPWYSQIMAGGREKQHRYGSQLPGPNAAVGKAHHWSPSAPVDFSQVVSACNL